MMPIGADVASLRVVRDDCAQRSIGQPCKQRSHSNRKSKQRSLAPAKQMSEWSPHESETVRRGSIGEAKPLVTSDDSRENSESTCSPPCTPTQNRHFSAPTRNMARLEACYAVAPPSLLAQLRTPDSQADSPTTPQPPSSTAFPRCESSDLARRERRVSADGLARQASSRMSTGSCTPPGTAHGLAKQPTGISTGKSSPETLDQPPEPSASLAVADVDCSCSLALSACSTPHTSSTLIWPPTPSAAPSTPQRPQSRHIVSSIARSASGNSTCQSSFSRSSLSRSTSTTASQALSLGAHSAAISTSSASSTIELSASLEPSGALPGAGGQHRRTPSTQAQQQQRQEAQKRSAMSQMVHWVQKDTMRASAIAEGLLQAWGLAIASELATALFPVAVSHPVSVAVIMQFSLGHPDLLPEQVWAMHILLVRAPKCALEMLLQPCNRFQPFRAVAAIASDLQNPAVAQSIVRVLHHAAAAGVPVATSIELAPLVAACERLQCAVAVRDLLVALWQQNQNDTDAAHNLLARMQCPEITKPHLDVDPVALRQIAPPGTDVQKCFMLVPTATPPFFGRQLCTFPAAKLSEVAPSASQVASSTLGTGVHGVVVRAQLRGLEHALKVPYRTAEASMGLQTEIEAHSRIWAALAERGHAPSPHLCLARFVVYTDIAVHGCKLRLIDGLAMPCVDGTLWDWWHGGVAGAPGAPVSGGRTSSTKATPSSRRSSTAGNEGVDILHVAWMALTLADGLCSLHSVDSVHNDLHPQNVGVRRIGGKGGYESHVLDLGRVVTSGTPCERFRDTGAFWPVWHPPEAICDAAEVDGCVPEQVQLTPAADVWAFGCVLVSLLRGSAPQFAVAESWGPAQWSALASGSLWRQALHAAAEDVMGLKAVAKECLCSEPGARPTMAVVRDALRDAAQSAGMVVGAVNQQD